MSGSARLLSPADVAARIHEDFGPTPEQATAIAAQLRPHVIVAGAGSGKTETMGLRVVWLVANGLVEPQRVLGLTFTRKAAAELGERIRRMLRALRAEHERSPFLTDEVALSLHDGEPTVSTYHSYASALVGEHALRIGLEPSVRLIGEAVSLAILRRGRRVAHRHDGRGRPRRQQRHRRRARPCRRARRAPAPASRGACAAPRRSGTHLVDAAPRTVAARPKVPEPLRRPDRQARRPPRRAADGRAIRRAQAGAGSDGLRRPGGGRGAHRPGASGGRRDRAQPVRRGPARRIPGHRRGPAGAAHLALRRSPGHGGRRPAAVHLRLARCQRRQPRALPRRLLRRPGRRIGRRRRCRAG